MSAPDLIETEGTVVIEKMRCFLAMEAVQEIAELCNVLSRAIPQDAYPEHPIVRGFSARISDLAHAALAAITDAHDQLSDIAARVRITLPEMEGKA